MNPMNPESLLAKIAELESRLRVMEDWVVPHDSIPWSVICAAVAAVMPNAKIIDVQPLTTQTSQMVLQNLWSFGGRMSLLASHRLR